MAYEDLDTRLDLGLDSPPPPGPPPELPPSGERRRRRHRRRPRLWRGVSTRGRAVRAALAALLLLGISWFGWSFGHALTVPGGASLGANATEWVRDHGGAGIVRWVEREWYLHHQPPKGGRPAAGLIPSAGPSTRAPTTKGPPHLQPPGPVVPLASPPLPGEGQWHPIGRLVGGLPAEYAAYIRPDAVHTSLVTGVAWMDTDLLRAKLYSGSEVPGGSWPTMTPIPPDQRPALVSAFNSGFRMQDSRGGYYTDGRLAKPLVDGAASLVIRANGVPTVAKWGRDAVMGPDVVSVRQNLALVVDNGTPVPGLQNDSNISWGATFGNAVLAWRSGVGVTANGALVYAGGPGLSVYTLAQVLAHAGAVRAMELDINSAWVNFLSYAQPPGLPAAPDNGTKLLPGMQWSTGHSFEASTRDSIVLSATPGADALAGKTTPSSTTSTTRPSRR
ncbi:MAG: phosphodiester glycosidase family protein [Actinobacteria bacterium]|nr:MAG: phosphodiester glycosidase family protein [Actinomycetota bacterium]